MSGYFFHMLSINFLRLSVSLTIPFNDLVKLVDVLVCRRFDHTPAFSSSVLTEHYTTKNVYSVTDTRLTLAYIFTCGLTAENDSQSLTFNNCYITIEFNCFVFTAPLKSFDILALYKFDYYYYYYYCCYITHLVTSMFSAKVVSALVRIIAWSHVSLRLDNIRLPWIRSPSSIASVVSYASVRIWSLRKHHDVTKLTDASFGAHCTNLNEDRSILSATKM